VNFTTIYKLKNELREAIHEEGSERIQELWDRMERWIDSPPMSQRKNDERLVPLSEEMGGSVRLHGRPTTKSETQKGKVNALPDVTPYLLLLSVGVSLVWSGIDYVEALRKNLRGRR
jgi:hypothetical protein